MSDAVRVTGLGKRYGDRRVLDSVSFSAAEGEVVALLGPNGAGKTTTVEILEGYRQRDAGAVEVLGRDPSRAGPEHRARIGIMLQSGGIDPRITPRELLRLHARFFRRPRDPDELIDLVELREVARTRYRALSGGERQRVALALALVGRPDLLMLDEPTAGMDPAAKARTRELIRSLRDGGATVLLTTHELADVERAADRVVIIHRGQVVAAGAPGELVAEAVQRVRFRLAAPLSSLEREALATRLGGSLLEEAGGGYRLEGGRPSPEILERLAAWCAGNGMLLVELHVGSGTLEERYLELTRGEGPS